MSSCGILKKNRSCRPVANEERKPSFFGQKRLKRYCEESQKKQNRRRCSITVLEGLRGKFTRDTVLAPTCLGKSIKRENSGKLWVLGTGVRCWFSLMTKQKFLVDDKRSASAIIKEGQIFVYRVVNAERGTSTLRLERFKRYSEES